MTTPTQAQIEAAAKEMYQRDYDGFPWERSLDEDKESYRRAAETAITAAAEVGSLEGDGLQNPAASDSGDMGKDGMSQEPCLPLVTPTTQAQIEAAAVELSSEKPWPWECCLEIARLRALVAAAEVGESELKKENRLMNDTIAKCAIEIFELENKLAATIERCAQVMANYAGMNSNEARAAAIRALKEIRE